ncbi:MAG: hypothetical protein H6631_00545 [Anaerolineaceae bacterium]|nr:hypothetical protein [Anaerolineaceae bacterium]MCB9100283.1 hypothetical protein [Anaerolineales bacterium]
MDKQKRTILQRILLRIKDEIVQEVPADLAACEICRKTDCRDDEWITCENRIAHAKCLEEIRLHRANKNKNNLAT